MSSDHVPVTRLLIDWMLNVKNELNSVNSVTITGHRHGCAASADVCPERDCNPSADVCPERDCNPLADMCPEGECNPLADMCPEGECNPLADVSRERLQPVS